MLYLGVTRAVKSVLRHYLPPHPPVFWRPWNVTMTLFPNTDDWHFVWLRIFCPFVFYTNVRNQGANRMNIQPLFMNLAFCFFGYINMETESALILCDWTQTEQQHTGCLASPLVMKQRMKSLRWVCEETNFLSDGTVGGQEQVTSFVSLNDSSECFSLSTVNKPSTPAPAAYHSHPVAMTVTSTNNLSNESQRPIKAV